MAIGYVVSQSERICMPTLLYDRYSDSFDDWVDVTSIGENWRVFTNVTTGEAIDCNQHYKNMVIQK